MASSGWLTTLLFVVEEAIRLGFSIRVIMRRLPVAVSLSWLTVILLFPFFGAAVYLLLGEYRLGNKRHTRIRNIQRQWTRLIVTAFPQARRDVFPHLPETAGLAKLTRTLLNSPVLPGNSLELMGDTNAVFDRLLEDVAQAQVNCDMEFYIWNEGGRVDEIVAALLLAAKRGVTCRALIDSVGSSSFFKGRQIQEMRDGGIQVQEALPAGLLTAPFVRPDLRLHRKIVTIDGKVGYTGSMNMADPRFFKKDAGVGEWVDAMVRVQGPVVQMLQGHFLSAWSTETGEALDMTAWGHDMDVAHNPGHADIQVLPSGPSTSTTAIEQILLSAIYAASRELILTTPYFVPSEALLMALTSAAGAGVDVTLIVPARVDSILVSYTSQSFLRDLALAGVKVALFDGGLLHTKSITIDGHLSLFGSLNLDPRSLKLNFELTLAIYDKDFAQELRALQLGYLNDSRLMNASALKSQPWHVQLLENTVRLLSPVL